MIIALPGPQFLVAVRESVVSAGASEVDGDSVFAVIATGVGAFPADGVGLSIPPSTIGLKM